MDTVESSRLEVCLLMFVLRIDLNLFVMAILVTCSSFLQCESLFLPFPPLFFNSLFSSILCLGEQIF